MVESSKTRRAPFFLGVGAQKCGATRWHRLLWAHPEGSEPCRKERHFFDRFWVEPFEERQSTTTPPSSRP
jgi:hypothetical protein